VSLLIDHMTFMYIFASVYSWVFGVLKCYISWSLELIINDKGQGTVPYHVSIYAYAEIIINHTFLIGNEIFFKGFTFICFLSKKS
jgi:hypothetical protein